MRVLPKTPQMLFTQDPIAFRYLYEQVRPLHPMMQYDWLVCLSLQVLHEYLDNDEIECDNETAIKLGCLELRYFFSSGRGRFSV